MTLHDACPIELQGTPHLERLLNVLVAEESKAIEQYDQVIDSLKATHKNVKEALEEIKRDELNHIGILIRLISTLDASAATAMVEGANEGK